MPEDMDTLQISIVGESKKADAAIDKLCSKLGTLQTKLGGMNTGNFTKNMSEVSNSLQAIGNLKFNSLSSLSNGIAKLGNMNAAKIQQSNAAIRNFGDSLKALDKIQVTDNMVAIGSLGNSIAKLSAASAKASTDNIEKLTVSVSKMMKEFSRLPAIRSSVVRMAEATAKFSRTGRTGAMAADGLSKSFKSLSRAVRGIPSTLARVPKSLARLPGQFKGVSNGLQKAANGFRNLRTSILSSLGVVGGIYGLVRAIKTGIDYASQLKEVQNVIDVSFGSYRDGIEKFAKTSIKNFGISALSAKQTAGRFQAMGMAAGIARRRMADMSVEMTKLSADMASFYDRSQADVARALESVLTGTTKPLRQYGIDLTQATVQEWAMKNGMDANMKSMSQAEKIMLRYNYVLAASKAAQKDFQRTQGTWANQIRILKEQLKALAGLMGTAFIHMLKPMVKALNTALSAVYSFVETVVNALGKIFGWKMEKTKPASIDVEDYEDAADAMGDMSDGAGGTATGLGKAAENAKKLNRQLQKTDELNVLHSEDLDDIGGGKSGGSGKTGTTGAGGGEITKTDDSIFDMIDFTEPFKSKIKDLEGLGNYIRDALIKEMGKIEWNKVYEKAAGFGTGLANFLNGLFAEDKNGKTVFGSLGTTIGGALNTAIMAALSFSEKFKWSQFGENIADGINKFFEKWKPKWTGKALASIANGIGSAFLSAVTKIKWKTIGEKLKTALTTFFKNWKPSIPANAVKNLTNGLIDMISEAVPKKKDMTAFGNKVRNAVVNALMGINFSKAAKTTANLANSIVALFIAAVPTKQQFSAFGTKIGSAINDFFATFDFKAAGKAINKFADGILKFLISAVEKVDWDKVGKSIGDFFSGLKADQIIIDFLHLGAALTKAVLKALKEWAKKDPVSFILALAIEEIRLKKKGGGVLTGSILGDLISTAASKVLPSVVNVGKVIGKVVIDTIKTVKDKSLDIAKAIVEKASGLIPKAVEIGKTAGKVVINTIKTVKDKSLDIAKEVASKVKDFIPKTVRAGKVAVSLLVDEITAAATKGKELAKMCISAIKSALKAAGMAISSGTAGTVFSIAIPVGISLIAATIITKYNEEHADDNKPETDPTELFGNPQENKAGLDFWIAFSDAAEKAGKGLSTVSTKLKTIRKKIQSLTKKKLLNGLKTISGYIEKMGTAWDNLKGTVTLKVGNLKKQAKKKLKDIQDYWAKEKPSISIETVITGLKTIKDKISDKWTEVQNWWSKTKKSIHIPVSASGMITAVSDKWKKCKKWWKNKMLHIKFKLPTWSSLVNKLKSLWNTVIKKVSGLFTITVNGGKTKTKKGKKKPRTPAIGQKNGGVWNPKTGQKFATGGFPNSADIFMANENGVPELIGTMGRRTAVASGREITGITKAVNSQSDREAALLTQAIGLLGQIARKDFGISERDIGRAARSYGRDYYNRTGDNAFIF